MSLNSEENGTSGAGGAAGNHARDPGRTGRSRTRAGLGQAGQDGDTEPDQICRADERHRGQGPRAGDDEHRQPTGDENGQSRITRDDSGD